MKKPKVDIYQSDIDGAWIVHIDTDPDGECDHRGPKPLRVYINDGETVYENPTHRVLCTICKRLCSGDLAHLHQGEWVGDECCWDERLRMSE